ncbi:restriction endonuclease subunit S [Blautia sp. XA-2221]|uniref:restriction endonuclease subunit S n=1 Tax=Blautia sp. XA-2221 TaxID=2903961 RepID=UPI002379F22D|nr:restriction endonuclease subunit S [Blautia sp. XA-2221]
MRCWEKIMNNKFGFVGDEDMVFNDVLEIRNGRNQKNVENLDGEYPIYGSGGIMGYADDYICEADTVIIGRKGSINNPIFVEEPFWNVDTAFGLSAKREVLLPRYLYYFCRNFDFERLNKAVTIPSLTKSDLLKIEIELPSMESQQKIVDNLSKIERIIQMRKQEFQKLDDLIKARFIEMFGDININDKNWDCKPLGELCTIVRGGSPRPIEQFLGGDVPWIKIGDATDGDNTYLRSTNEHIIQEGVKKSRLVKTGSLIFANCGVSLGFARIITFDGCIHDGWLAMEDIDERLDKVFLLQALNQMTEHFRAIAPAGTQPNLNTTIMKAYKQVIPPIELQKEYIRFIEQTDKSKVAIQAALDKTQLLFDSLMQKYFG